MNTRKYPLIPLVLSLALVNCGGGGSASKSVPQELCYNCGAPPVQSPKPNTSRVAFIGDSWMRGVGTSAPCSVTTNSFAFAEPTMVAPCGGTSIADDIATALHATAMQNLALGGAYIHDALDFEAPKIDPSATLVIVLIGLNDEKALADSIGSTTETLIGWYGTTPFLETVAVMPTYYTELLAAIQAQAPQARIAFVKPARLSQIAVYNYGPEDAALDTQLGVLDAAISATGDAVADLGPANIYANANFVPSGCPTPGASDCTGHPDDAGAAAIAALIVAGL